MILLVGIGGAIGAVSRYFFVLYFSKRVKFFPLGTFFVNSSGSFLLGILYGLYLSNQISEWVWFLFGIGFCGAYTTFSTFGNETVKLFQAKQFKIAIMYVLSSVLIGLLGVAIVLFYMK